MSKISREKVLDMLDKIEEEIAEGEGFQYEKWRKYVCEMDTKTGEWIYDENGMGPGSPAWICSNCRQKNDMIPTYIQYPAGMKQVVNPYVWAGSKFCPNCGQRKGKG